MAEVVDKIFSQLNPSAPLIHEDSSGSLPAARIAIEGEHGEPAANAGEPSVLAYVPSTDDAGQWHPISDLLAAAPATDITSGTFNLSATSVEIADLTDPGWQDLQEKVLGAGSGRLTVSATVPLSLYSSGNSLRTIGVRLMIDGYATASQTATCATDSTAGNTTTITFSAATYNVPLLSQHRIRVQIDRPSGDALSTVYTAGCTIVVASTESEPLTTGGDLSGPTDDAQVVGIYGSPIAAAAAAPAVGEALVWDGMEWAPETIASPVLYNGDLIYGAGFADGVPGANVNVPATSTVVGNSTTIVGTTANTIDSNDTTSWRTFNNGYVAYDLGAAAPAIRGWRVRQVVSNPLFGATSVVLAGSDNNSTWTNIDTWTSAPAVDSGTRTLGSDSLYRYYRVTGTGRTYFEIQTVELNVSSTVFAEEERLPLGTAGQILAVNDTETAPEWVDNFSTEMRIMVKNSTGSTLYKGQVVYISGAVGSNPLISLSDASTEPTSSKTLGLLYQDLDNGDTGYVVVEGTIVGVDTSGAATEGVSVWLSETPGAVQFGAPPAKPAHAVYLGVVVRKHATVGEIEIKVQNGYELNELHDVNTTGVDDGDVLTYDLATGFWVAAAPSGGGSGDATSIQGTPVSETDPTAEHQAIVYDGTEYRPYRLKASDLATILTPIFNEDGTVVFDEDGVILAEVNN